MINLDKYLTKLFEQDRFGMGMGARGGPDRKPSPVAAYELAYGKRAPGGMRGRYPGVHSERKWNGIIVDFHLKNKWLNDLSRIKEIEIRASCEGHEEDWISFIGFRITTNKESDKNYLEKVKRSLNKGITKCNYEIGQQGRPRFIVAAKLWYDQPGWEQWWNTLASRVQRAVR